MKTILITGASGFIGANLLREAIARGHRAHAFLRTRDNRRLRGLEDDFTAHTVDLGDREGVAAAVTALRPEYVFHLATHGAYPSQTNAEGIVRTNVIGTINLMDAFASLGSGVFVNTGSSSDYGARSEPMRENHALEPDTLYGITKAAATQYGEMLARAKRLPIATLRLFSVYGPFEEETRLIPTIMRALVGNGTLALGSPHNVRDFVYVKDVCDAYFRAAESPPGGVINICTGKETSVGEVVETALQIAQSEIKPQWGSVAGRPYDKARWVGDGDKAEKLLSWRPRYTLEAGLKETYEWFKNL